MSASSCPAPFLAGCLISLACVTPTLACGDCHAHRHEQGPGHPHGSPVVKVLTSPGVSPSGSTAAPFSFAVVADTQGNPGFRAFLPDLVRDIGAHAPDATVFPGDLVGTGTVATFADWELATRPLGDSRYMVPGNHDLPTRPATNGDWQAAFPWLPDSQTVPNVATADPGDVIRGVDKMDYYFDIGGARFISVATDRDAVPGESGDVLGGVPPALDWFQSVMSLPSTVEKDHVFVFTHHPVTTHPFDRSGGTNGEWWRSAAGTNDQLDANGATALMAGHWHFYQSSRPDPDSDTLELIHGTGGGGFEGAPQDNFHGFSIITVDGPRVSAEFYGDADGATNGWAFDDLLDAYVITDALGPPTGELARYAFDPAAPDQDASDSPLSKGHPLNFRAPGFRALAAPAIDPERGGALRLVNGFADARATGEGNLAVVGDLTLSIAFRPTEPLAPGVDNMLIAFGDADDHANGAAANNEAANYAYQLSLTDDGRLRFAWEHDVAVLHEVYSTARIDDVTGWTEIEVQRDADTQTVAFYANGERLGAPVAYEHNATGAGSGSLYLGALPNGASNFNGWIDDVVISSAGVTVLLGDLDSDGDLDLDDWSQLKALLAEPLIEGAPGYEQGDLNVDGARDLSDLVLFRQAFERTRGETVEQALAALDVPEPATWVIAVAALALSRGTGGIRTAAARQTAR